MSGRPPEGEHLVCVHEVADPFELGLIKSLLESADVPFVVLNEAVSGSIGLPLTYGSARVMVARRDADDARAILGQAQQGSCEGEGEVNGHG